MPEDYVICAGSRGREYFDASSGRVTEIEPLPRGAHELLERLHGHLVELCMRPGNTKFLGIGSGLQYKYGELNIAHNDPSRSVPDIESARFRAEVQSLVKRIDPDSVALDVRDTGTDIEIAPCMENRCASFSKYDGVLALDRRLQLGLEEGPSLICGDTPSDLPMVRAAVHLMTEKCRGLDTKEPASKLAVLFVISPEQHRRTPTFVDEVQAVCSESGAHCAILPSPDVLGAALARFTQESADGDTIAGIVGQRMPVPKQARIPCTL
jgi:hypothetical protein